MKASPGLQLNANRCQRLTSYGNHEKTLSAATSPMPELRISGLRVAIAREKRRSRRGATAMVVHGRGRTILVRLSNQQRLYRKEVFPAADVRGRGCYRLRQRWLDGPVLYQRRQAA